MMKIPYKDILYLFLLKQKEENKKGIILRLSKRKQQKELRKIIKLLEDTYYFRRNVMYKEDICNFCVFLESLQTILDRELDEFKPSNQLYIIKLDNINYQIVFTLNSRNAEMHLLETKIKITTMDTVLESNNYMIYTKEVIEKNVVPKISQRTISEIEADEYCTFNINNVLVYRSIIATIIKYLEELVE